MTARETCPLRDTRPEGDDRAQYSALFSVHEWSILQSNALRTGLPRESLATEPYQTAVGRTPDDPSTDITLHRVGRVHPPGGGGLQSRIRWSRTFSIPRRAQGERSWINTSPGRHPPRTGVTTPLTNRWRGGWRSGDCSYRRHTRCRGPLRSPTAPSARIAISAAIIRHRRIVCARWNGNGDIHRNRRR